MKLIAKSLIKIANELDDRGHLDLANRLDKVIVAIANDDGMSMVDEGEGMSMADGGADMSVGSPSATAQPATPGTKARSDSHAQQMLQVQKLFNAYLKKQEELHGISNASKAIAENGKVNDRRTWTAISYQFGWEAGKDFKNYKNLIELLRGKISELGGSSETAMLDRTNAALENEREVLSLWSRIISTAYDPVDVAKYAVGSFEELLDKLQNLPPQRMGDALHGREGQHLASIAKKIKDDPIGTLDSTAHLVEELKKHMLGLLTIVESES